MSPFRSRLALAVSRSFPLALLTIQCTAVPPRGAGVERTYQGLTLAEWQAIPYFGHGHLSEGTGNITFERDVERAIEALREFARESRPALEQLRGLGWDLDEDVREEADAALVHLAHSAAPNQELAWEALMGLVGTDDALVSAAAVGQLVNELDDEEVDWEPLGPRREEELARCVEGLLFEPGDEEFEIALEGIAVLSARSAEHERRFAAALARDPGSLRAPDAADELNELAWDFVEPDLSAPRCKALALEAARVAVALAPEVPNYWDTLAIAHWRLGNRTEALAASRRAVEAAGRLDSRQRERIEANLELFGQDASWTDAPPETPR